MKSNYPFLIMLILGLFSCAEKAAPNQSTLNIKNTTWSRPKPIWNQHYANYKFVDERLVLKENGRPAGFMPLSEEYGIALDSILYQRPETLHYAVSDSVLVIHYPDIEVIDTFVLKKGAQVHLENDYVFVSTHEYANGPELLVRDKGCR